VSGIIALGTYRITLFRREKKTLKPIQNGTVGEVGSGIASEALNEYQLNCPGNQAKPMVDKPVFVRFR
jgi:hypothetical protein